MPGLALVIVAMLAGRRIDGHAANGIDDHLGLTGMLVHRMLVAVVRMIMRRAATAAGGLLVGIVLHGHHDTPKSSRLLKPIPCRGI